MTSSKEIQTELRQITLVSAGSQDISSILDVTTYRRLIIYIDHAQYNTGLAGYNSPTEYRIETSEKSSGNDTWRTVYSVTADSNSGLQVNTDKVELPGATRIETNDQVPSNGNIMFFYNPTSVQASEWAKIINRNTAVGSEYVDIQDGLTYQQYSDSYYNKSEHYIVNLNVSAMARIRVVCNNNNSTNNIAIIWRCACTTST